ncbi:hypothetical protein D3C78_1629980 [compost metagenome]
MKIDDLYIMSEQLDLDTIESNKVNRLLEAVNDWPTAINSTEELISAVRRLTKRDRLTLDVLNLAIKGLNPAEYAWQIESISSLIAFVNLNKANELTEEMIDSIL